MFIRTIAPKCRFPCLLAYLILAGALPLLCLTDAKNHISYENRDPGILRGLVPNRIALLEKLNRADHIHLQRLKAIVVPNRWDLDELEYSPLPRTVTWAAGHPKAIVVHLPAQVFGAYESGTLVRWGPISSGREQHPTPNGVFHLNWRSRQRISTDDEKWLLRWYYNFHSGRGLAFHEYSMPGRPASHACLRLLRRDAMWIFQWGEGWKLNEGKVIERGTPLLIYGEYDFKAPPPWLQPSHYIQTLAIPDIPFKETSVR